ncbi:MAG TPA: hypothetical protein VIH15_12075 [Casimicrobiaceae bacterium]|jgi:hypothetical protein
MQAFIVLIVLPVLIGFASGRLFRDTTRATFAATLAAPLAMYACLRELDPTGTWNWLATLLVSPLVIALALATVLLCLGRPRLPKRSRGRGA